jgi:hypothetical protein
MRRRTWPRKEKIAAGTHVAVLGQHRWRGDSGPAAIGQTHSVVSQAAWHARPVCQGLGLLQAGWMVYCSYGQGPIALFQVFHDFQMISNHQNTKIQNTTFPASKKIPNFARWKINSKGTALLLGRSSNLQINLN